MKSKLAKLCNKPGEVLDKEFTMVTRPARQVVKLYNIRDTPIIEDMERVRKMASETLSNNGQMLKIKLMPNLRYLSPVKMVHANDCKGYSGRQGILLILRAKERLPQLPILCWAGMARIMCTVLILQC